ncbi:uncharacterized protein [Primulina huaijiensis]|uniref:uncharacterized protein n=1 Tax=Primulina huaijiensis TaxID=1492673 RepID=UPI003CC7236E
MKDTIACPSERGSQEKTWKPPRSSTLKLNVDAIVDEDQNLYSVGGVVRDTQGQLLLAFGKQINQPISVAHDVQVASDSLLTVQAVITKQEYLSYIGFCTAEIIKNLKAPMVSDIIHERRSANKVAHHIAHFILSSPSSFVWVNGEFPFWLLKLVIDDYLQ